MAVPAFYCLRPSFTLSHQHQNRFFPINYYPRSSNFSYKIRAQLTPSGSRKRFVHISPLNSASVNGYRIENEIGNQEEFFKEKNVKVKNQFRELIDKLPGGSWWNLSTDQIDDNLVAEPVSVLKALHRIWDLISEDRRVVFAAFAALLVSSVSFLFLLLLVFYFPLFLYNLFTAISIDEAVNLLNLNSFFQLSEISIPHFLTASIFSAQNSNISKFHQNVSILVLMCIISGISRSSSCTVKAPFFLNCTRRRC